MVLKTFPLGGRFDRDAVSTVASAEDGTDRVRKPQEGAGDNTLPSVIPWPKGSGGGMGAKESTGAPSAANSD